jgi:hypothetical protein
MNASPRTKSAPAAATAPEERTQWRERYRRSGLSQEAFARTHGLQLNRLRYWLYHPRRPELPAARAPRWQEIRVHDWPTTPGWGAEVSLPGGCTIRLQSGLARELVGPLLTRER